jgi:phage tail protein X
MQHLVAIAGDLRCDHPADFLDWALTDFSGYVAADELYDGPFCILSAVDNRCYKRLLYDVLDHDPTHDDIRAFLRRLHTALSARDLTLFGVTTDGSALYPEPLREVFGKVRHQICQFHIVAEVVKAVVGAVASARKGLAAQQPKLRKGRPSTPAAKQAARTKKRLEAQRAALFTARSLFVQRHLNKTERKTLWRVSRGLPHLQALRAIMEQVYALFDRRCRTQTALDKLAKLRRRVQRFTALGDTLKKLFAPTLEKALTFLDDKLLPSTSNAVERGNRRYRKMQKSVYRVRTQAQIRARLALDMWREAHAEGRQQTLVSLHRARAG